MRFEIKQLMLDKERTTGEKVTYRKIAAESGISTGILSRLSTGKQKQIALDTIDRLLEYFECDPNDLIVRVE